MARSVVRFLLLLVVTTIPLPAAAATQDWEESAQFDIRLNGQIDITARIFQPTSYSPHMILMSEKLSAPVLIDLGKKQAFKISGKSVQEMDGFLKTNGVPKGGKGVAYSMTDGATVFSIDGKKIAIKVRPPLVGEVSSGVILAHSPDYKIRMQEYKPKASSVAKLKAYGKKTRVVVMFATWCSTCKIVLPKLLRVLHDAGNPNFETEFFGIAMGGEEPREALQRYGHDYPAVIFLQNGKEVDRIIGDPPGAMEDAILGILK